MLADLIRQFETASTDYAAVSGINRDDDWFILKLHEELGELTQVWNKATGRGRRRGLSDEEIAGALADETADLLGHVLLFAAKNGLDLPAAIQRKWFFTPVV